jgi:hypothetical protein
VRPAVIECESRRIVTPRSARERQPAPASAVRPVTNWRLVISYQLSALSSQLSAFSFQLSAFSSQHSPLKNRTEAGSRSRQLTADS